ncbi:MAG: hypothetical protein KF893_03495 [Caldilineaceae bacterium]|nr:hypothetical protein [Caldilineaceae bacterium]
MGIALFINADALHFVADLLYCQGKDSDAVLSKIQTDKRGAGHPGWRLSYCYKINF